MKRDNRAQAGASSEESLVTKRSKRDDDEDAARLVRSARAAFNDEPATKEEAAIIAKLRKELPRPTPEEIAALGKKLARRR